MRNAIPSGVMVLLLGFCAPSWGQAPRDVRVLLADTEVRSGPSDSANFYATNRLRKGDTVEVVAEKGEWLAIRPPAGSFSYVNARFLSRISPNQPTYAVTTLQGVKAPVLIGSELLKDHRPTNVGVKLEPGAQVVSIGPTMGADGWWMPIEPPDAEVRYVRARLVGGHPVTPGVVTAAHTVSASGNASTFTPAPPAQASNAPSANPPPTPEMLWYCACQAELRGEIPRAIALYAQVAALASQSKPQLAADAQRRATFLQNGHQAYGGSSFAPAAAPGRSYPLAGEPADTGVRLIAPPGARPVTASTVSTARIAPGPAAADPSLPPGWASYKGRLRRAGRDISGLQTYVVEQEYPNLRPIAYVVAGPGVNLSALVEKQVEVRGPAHYRGDLRNNYMTVMGVAGQ
jgi:SH3-like domain-containing protein